MKLALICSSAEPGRDGVGDYSVRLGTALVALGHQVRVIAERDFAVNGTQALHGERDGIPVSRLPGNLPNDQRGRALAEVLDHCAADWVVVQFVCWGFARDGVLDPPLHALIAALAGRRVAVYCHELWLGLERGASLRHRLWGWRQRRGILRFLAQLQPTLVMTSNAVYGNVLQHFGWKARIVPLFSNIPFCREGRAKFLSMLDRRSGSVLVAVFGSVDPQWQPQAALRWIAAEARRRGREVLLVIAGRRSPQAEKLVQRIAREVESFATVVTLGEVSSEIVSGMLQEADIGLPVCDWLRLGKSGVAAAMTAHGLPLLVARHDERYRDLPDLTITHAPSVFRFDAADPPDFDRVVSARSAAVDTLRDISLQFEKGLQEAADRISSGS